MGESTLRERSVYVRLLIVLNYISVITIFIIALWIFGDVVGRYFLNRPIPGTTELIKTGILAIVFLGITYTLYRKKHIRTAVIVRRLPPAVGQWLNVLTSLIGMSIFVLVCIYGWEAAVKAWKVQEFEGVQLRVPTYPSRFIMVLGSGLMVIQYALDLIYSIKAAFKLKIKGTT
jgi:TRAP-type C4-dicarboxylate transport system permease small subunit